MPRSDRVQAASDQGAVARAVGEELSVRPGRSDPAAVEEDHLVGGVQQQRAARHHHGGAPGPLGAQPGGDPGLGVGVDGRGRLDQDQHSGSRVSARASTSRCRWPPDRLRPRSVTTVASRSGIASRMSSAAAAVRARLRRRRRRARRAARPAARRTASCPVSETTIRRPDLREAQPAQRYAAQPDLRVRLRPDRSGPRRWGDQAEPVGQLGGVLGRVGDDGGQQPGRTRRPERSSTSSPPGAGAGSGSAGSAWSGS